MELTPLEKMMITAKQQILLYKATHKEEPMSCLYFNPKYTDAEIQQLENMHTKQLLNERNRLYHVSEYCADCCCDRYNDECKRCGSNHEFNMQQVKRILATREHVPNKRESKALRKARIKKGV